MAQFGQYRVYLLDWTGNKVAQLFPGDDFLSITWEHKRNQPGAYRCELVAETATKDRFLKHYQILIERNWGNAPGDWYEEYAGFHLGNHEWWVNSDAIDEHYWASIGLSPEWLVDQPLLQPVANTGNANWLYYDLWWHSGFADDVIKSMVGESMVSPADTDRDFTNVALQGNAGAGVWSCYEGSWIRLLDAITDAIGETGDKGGCDFRVERVVGGYEFKTYAPFFGTDRRRGNPDGNKPTVFSFENGNMRNPDYKEIWAEEVTAAYGLWQGGGMERSIYERTNAAALAESPYSRREGAYDLRDVSQPDQIDAILDQALIDDGLQTFVTAEILQTDACLYGRDWWFGDLVTLDLPGGRTFDMRVVEVQGGIDGENEERIEGVIELWTRAAVA